MFVSIVPNCTVLSCQCCSVGLLCNTRKEFFCFFLWYCQPISDMCHCEVGSLSPCVTSAGLRLRKRWFSHGTKCVIIVEAVAHSLLPPPIPHPCTTSLTPLCNIRKSSVNNAEMEIRRLCAKQSSAESASLSCDVFFCFFCCCIWCR